jgi:filamentous hemagglutinin
MPTNNNYIYSPAPVDTGASVPAPIGPLDTAPGSVPPGPGLGLTSNTVPTPVIPQVEQSVDLTANANAVTGPNITAGNQQRYIPVLANGAVIVTDANSLNFLGNGVTVSSYGTTGANITIDGYGNSNVAALLAAFGSNTISTTGNIAGGSLILSGNLTVSGTTTTVNTETATALSASGNITGGNLITSGLISAAGNVKAGNVLGNIQAADGNGAVQFNVNGFLGAAAGFNYDSSTGSLFAKSLNGAGDPVSGTGAIYGGLGSGYTALGSTVLAQFSGNVNSYAQLNIQNISSGNNSSADYIITANNGTDTTYYLDLGLAGNNHADPAFFGDTSTKNDGYLYVNGSSQTGPSGGTGNLILGSTNGVIKMFVGNTAQANVVATLSAGTFSVLGNITSGNVSTTGIVSAGGTVTGTYLYSSGAVSGAGNVVGGNVLTAGIMSSTGNAVHGNILNNGLISSVGNSTAANYLTAGVLSATGNVTGGNVLTVGIMSSAGNATHGNVSAVGRVLVGNGSPSAPSFGFTSDGAIDTGFYWVSDGNLGVTNNGVQSAQFYPTGVFGQIPTTVGNLPSATTAGLRAFVTDSNRVASGNFGATVATGGSNTVSVFSNGSNWLIG